MKLPENMELYVKGKKFKGEIPDKYLTDDMKAMIEKKKSGVVKKQDAKPARNDSF